MKKQLITLAALAGGFFLGASALVALAAGSTWSAPHQTPSNCDPALDSGCNAPINVGSYFQRKSGKLGLGVLQTYGNESNRPLLDVVGSAIVSNLGITGALTLGGTGITVGQVLTAGSVSADGKSATVGWGTASGGGGGTNFYVKRVDNDTSSTFYYQDILATQARAYPASEVFCDKTTDRVISGGGVADTNKSNQARRAIWYLGPDLNRTDGFICASTDPNEDNRLSGCDHVWAMCIRS